MTVLNELFNKASSANKENIAGQLAELAVKYESEKQAKKIAMLQKDQEMNDLKIQAKDAEISERESTITLFTFGGIIVGVLLIFVIRSNVLRKQANKELAKQKDIISSQKEEVESQKHLVEEKQKEILDSIHYAKRLQEAILPPLKFIDEHVPNNFVLYHPKDVVAGDFYWAETKEDKFFIAAADCTGHGVPGAMVSVVCSNALNRTVNEFGITDTGKILDKTRELVLETFAKGNAEVKDGMDISLLCIDKQINKAFWSGANNPLWYVQSSVTSSEVEKSIDAGLEVPVKTVTSSEVEKSTSSGLDSARPDIQLIEIKADKQPIGKTDHAKPFTTHEIALQEGMLFYLFTDGFADQFGGPKGKKFKYKQLEEILIVNANKNMSDQHEILSQQFALWKGDLEQVDDVCVIGIKI
jgi:serine phosphatase RsbU (regulator of sigma subunit)